MKITQLSIANVKRITAITLSPEGRPVVLGGRNAQGKSSVLDAITYALAGKGAMPGRPVRDGADAAEIVLQVAGAERAYTIRRTITPAGGGALQITTGDGFRAPSPQALLDDLTAGGVAFDPLDFCRQKPADQRRTLAALAGLDTAAIDTARARAYEERTAIGRQQKAAEGHALSLPHHPDAPAEERTAGDLLTQIEAAEATNRRREQIIAEGRAEVAAGAAAIEEAKRLRDEAARLIAAADRHEAAAVAHAARADELRAQVPAAIDTAPMRDELASLESANAKVRTNAAKSDAIARAEALRAEYAAASEAIADLDAQKAAAIAAAAMPLPGLAVTDEGVTWQGVPLSQASQAEQLRVSVAIAMARNPALRVCLVREGALLDTDALAALLAAAETHDVQVFVERVGTGDEGAIIIEDGEVAQ